jgi:hypothetical protein
VPLIPSISVHQLDARIAALEHRVRTLESGNPTNNTLQQEPRTYKRVPKAPVSRIQVGYVPCPHGVGTEPWSSEVCAVCCSPWAGQYVCDKCGASDLTTPRYSCTVCANYDLCQACNDTDEHSQHTMVQIKHSAQKHGDTHPDATMRHVGVGQPNYQAQPSVAARPNATFRPSGIFTIGAGRRL